MTSRIEEIKKAWGLNGIVKDLELPEDFERKPIVRSKNIHTLPVMKAVIPSDTAPKTNARRYDRIIKAIYEEYGIKSVHPQDQRFSEHGMATFNYEWNAAFGEEI